MRGAPNKGPLWIVGENWMKSTVLLTAEVTTEANERTNQYNAISLCIASFPRPQFESISSKLLPLFFASQFGRYNLITHASDFRFSFLYFYNYRVFYSLNIIMSLIFALVRNWFRWCELRIQSIGNRPRPLSWVTYLLFFFFPDRMDTKLIFRGRKLRSTCFMCLYFFMNFVLEIVLFA